LTQTNDPNKRTVVIGKLIDESQAEVMYASVASMKNDSTIVNSAISDLSGDFRIENIESGRYVLRVDHIEYAVITTEPINLVKGDVKEIDDIVLTT
jgi:hypothetical protein